MVDWLVLRYSTQKRLAAWVGFALLTSAIVGAALAAEPGERPRILACLFLTASTISLIVETHRVRHVVGPAGLGYRGLLRRYPFVAWTAITSVHWSETMKRLTLHTNDGRVLRFSGLLNGLDHLATSLAEHAPHVQSDAATLAMLKAASSGQLPRGWW